MPERPGMRTGRDDPTYGTSMTTTHARVPAFENCPSAGDIARWFIDEMRGEPNVGGDAWWLSRDPHGSCYMVAHVDRDTQEFWLLDITTGDVSDLLFVMNGLDGEGVTWWQNPTTRCSKGWGSIARRSTSGTPTTARARFGSPESSALLSASTPSGKPRVSMLCEQDAEMSVFSLLRCPECGSGNVDCTSGRTHVHECRDCGLRHEWARTIR